MTLLGLLAGVPVLAGAVATLARSLQAGAWSGLLSTPGLAHSTVLCLWTGLAATVLATVSAHLTVMLAATARRSGWLRAAVLPYLALPHLAAGIGLVLLLGPSGLLLRLLSPWLTGFTRPPDWSTVQDGGGLALILGLTLKETPFLVLMLLGSLSQVPGARYVEAARTLGYGPLRAWLVCVTPLLQRQLRLPMVATLVYGITNVDMALTLAPQTPPPLSILVWQWFTSSRLSLLGPACAGAMLLLATTAAGIAVTAGLGAAGTAVLRRLAASGARREPGRAARALLRSIPVLFALLGVGAMAALILRGAAPMWRFPAVLPVATGRPLLAMPGQIHPGVVGTTVLIALLVTLAAVAVTLLAVEALRREPAWGRLVSAGLLLPLLLPQLAFLFGLTWLATLLHIDGSLAAVAWTHLLFALPYTWGLLWPARRAIDERHAAAAACLGAGPLRRWRTITAPLLLRPALVAAAIAFAVSTALYLPTLATGGGRVATIATQAAAAAASGVLHQAALYAAPQALLPLAFLCLTSLGAHAAYRGFRGMAP